MNLRFLLALMGVSGLLLGPSPAARALDSNYFVFDDLSFDNQTITFDTDATGLPLAAPQVFEEAVPLRDEYAALGVHFGGARGAGGGVVLRRDSDFGMVPRSGDNFLAFNREAKTQDGQTPREPLVLTFDFPVPSVSLYVGGGFLAESFRMDAYNRAGNFVGTASVIAHNFEPLSVANDAGISRVVVSRESESPRTTLSIPPITGAAGETVSVPLQVDDRVKGLAAVRITLSTSTAFSVTDAMQVTPGGLLPGALLETDLSVPNSLSVSAASANGKDGPGSVLLLSGLIPAGTPPGAYPLRLESAQLSDVLGKEVLTDRVDGLLTVTEARTAICGDLDSSGDLKISDAILALRIAVGLKDITPEYTLAACGYPLNVAFVVRVLRTVVGLTGPITPNAPPPAEPAFVTAATVSPETVEPGGVVKIQVTVTATGGPFDNGVVDVEVYNSQSVKVGQQFFESQSFAPGESRAYDVEWTAPAEAGAYVVNMGVFTTGWATNPHWNNNGPTITVGGG